MSLSGVPPTSPSLQPVRDSGFQGDFLAGSLSCVSPSIDIRIFFTIFTIKISKYTEKLRGQRSECPQHPAPASSVTMLPYMLYLPYKDEGVFVLLFVFVFLLNQFRAEPLWLLSCGLQRGSLHNVMRTFFSLARYS